MAVTKYDYGALEQEFVTTLPRLSIRELARKHGIDDGKVSSLHVMARRPDAAGLSWYDKQDQFEARTTDRSRTLLAAREAQRKLREAVVVDHAIDLIDEALISAKESIRATVEITDDEGKVLRTERKYRVQPRDVTALIDRLNLLFGRASSAQPSEDPISGHVTANVNVDAESEAGRALLGHLAGLTRSRSGSADAGAMGRASLPDAPDPR